MSAVPGPTPAHPGAARDEASTTQADVESAVGRFEGIDPTDVEATLTGGEALSETLTRALDEDSRR